MPHLDHTGPLGNGPKTGRKLGKCHKTDKEKLEQGKLGVGLGLKKKNIHCEYEGKRINYK